MPAERDLGKLLMIGLAGTSLLPEEREFLGRVRPAGVIYFRRNIESPAQLQALTRGVALAAGEPPLVGIDQEGGRVARLSEPFTAFPGNDFLGRAYRKTRTAELARAQAAAMAKELRAVGVNVNFTPVADVDSNPQNPIIGTRSFGGDPKAAGTLVAATVAAYRKARVACCAKHFPGHGDTVTDSHKELPVVNASRAVLMRREIPPFVRAIRAGVPLIMTAHVVYPALDPDAPATLSPGILTGLLRKRLRFRGVVVSDDLEMNAIAAHGEVNDAAVDAVAAGVDLLLVCKSLERSEACFRSLARIDPARADEALARVAALRKIYARPLPARFPAVPASGWLTHRRLAERIRRFT
jgi:beta-N-acetylhexosaminidase